MLDSPVVGGTVAVAAGNLGVLAAGPKEAFERAKFALESFAGRLFYMGEHAGMGQAGKVVNNAVAYAALLATCEAVSVRSRAYSTRYSSSIAPPSLVVMLQRVKPVAIS